MLQSVLVCRKRSTKQLTTIKRQLEVGHQSFLQWRLLGLLFCPERSSVASKSSCHHTVVSTRPGASASVWWPAGDGSCRNLHMSLHIHPDIWYLHNMVHQRGGWDSQWYDDEGQWGFRQVSDETNTMFFPKSIQHQPDFGHLRLPSHPIISFVRGTAPKKVHMPAETIRWEHKYLRLNLR